MTQLNKVLPVDNLQDTLERTHGVHTFLVLRHLEGHNLQTSFVDIWCRGCSKSFQRFITWLGERAFNCPHCRHQAVSQLGDEAPPLPLVRTPSLAPNLGVAHYKELRPPPLPPREPRPQRVLTREDFPKYMPTPPLVLMSLPKRVFAGYDPTERPL